MAKKRKGSPKRTVPTKDPMLGFEGDAYSKIHRATGVVWDAPGRRPQPVKSPMEIRKHELFLQAMRKLRNGEPFEEIERWSREQLRNLTVRGTK